MKRLFTLVLIATTYLCNAQGIEQGMYYTTKNSKVEITQCCADGRLNVTFLNNDGTKNVRELTAIKGTKDTYIYVGDGFNYIVLRRGDHIERYSFDNANLPEFLQAGSLYSCTALNLWSKDKAFIDKELPRIKELNEEGLKDNKYVNIYLADIVSLNTVPGDVAIPFGKLYGPLFVAKRKSASLSLQYPKTKITISKFDPKTSFSTGTPATTASYWNTSSSSKYKNDLYREDHPYNSENNSSIVVTTKYDTYKLTRSNFDPNMYILPRSGKLRHFIKFMADGNHIFGEFADVNSSLKDINFIGVYNTDKKFKLDKAAYSEMHKKGTLIKEKLRKEVFEYIETIRDYHEDLPKAEMKNPALEKEFLTIVNAHAKRVESNKTFYKINIIHDGWTTFRNEYTSAVVRKKIQIVAVFKDPQGNCGYDRIDISREYIGGKFEKAQYFSKAQGYPVSTTIRCDKVK